MIFNVTVYCQISLQGLYSCVFWPGSMWEGQFSLYCYTVLACFIFYSFIISMVGHLLVYFICIMPICISFYELSNFCPFFYWIVLVFFCSNFKVFYYILELLVLRLWNKLQVFSSLICHFLYSLFLVFTFSRDTFLHSWMTNLLLLLLLLLKGGL